VLASSKIIFWGLYLKIKIKGISKCSVKCFFFFQLSKKPLVVGDVAAAQHVARAGASPETASAKLKWIKATLNLYQI